MENKSCIKCGNQKSINEFYFRKDSQKYRDECKSCVSERSRIFHHANIDSNKKRQKLYRDNNKESLNASSKLWREANKERVTKNHLIYNELNKEQIILKKAAFYLKNKDRINAQKKEYNLRTAEKKRERQRKYDLENKQHLRKKRREWENARLDSDPEYRISKNVRRRITMALKTGTNGIRTCQLIGCSIPELKLHLESQFSEGMSWDNYGQWHIDHKIPLSWFNLTNESCLMTALNFRNLQPLWGIDNIKKSNKVAHVLSY